ncbi:phosphatidylglycerophosphatase A [Desulfobotulus alkaliphilus]|uniref:Phosphatidylglycerophosphatase A n=1 Tax=Desulfobotulus alkaliphilus TaxID=622671 RepID=A0A562RDY7_9BACT|nr:phosphatidylglycerophosphatase A [Desulfobotulus alkaliphilus]TWI67238.1 phosphatidylglycerophosphatase A [Desulfobotulus alkaliphilus]
MRLPENPVMFLATFAGTGNAKKAPGTMGTLAGIPFCALLLLLPLQVQMVVVMTAVLLGIMVCDKAAEELGEKDPSCVVLDEVLGLAVTLMFFPLSFFTVILGFFLFRFFDIVKPWPVNFFDERIPGGAGIVLDDVAAGLCAHLVLAVLFYVF